tara:strand:+ start:474 stop:695 length:222 start_codon:yes stop_codon:yes gene_type:complete
MEIKAISEQWEKPSKWNVKKQDDAIEVSDEEGDFVVSSITKNHCLESINEHLEKAKTAAAMELLLSMSDEHEA